MKKVTLGKLKAIFASLPNCAAWSLQLLKINVSKQSSTSYIGRELILAPDGALQSFVTEISERYGKNGGVLSSYHNVLEYNGSIVSGVIYWLDKTNNLIADEYKALITAIATPDMELDPLNFKAKAYILRGVIIIDEEEKPIKLISMQNPVTTLKHKFLRANGTFTEITDKVISLRTTIDVVIFEDTVYMFTDAGENLFNMERAYKSVCAGKLDEIEQCSIVTDYTAFSTRAKSGHNPRKFVAFNNDHLQKLRNAQNRVSIANKFNIPLNGNLFDTTQPGVTDKIIKLLCDRGMVDPFDNNPMEVAGSKKWE